MLIDGFGRKIDYLRVSVTDRCNLRCVYCMPAEGIAHRAHADVLTFEEIAEVVRAGVGLGIDRLRLTGGEPLVRKDIAHLIRTLSAIGGLRDIAMTTNGAYLREHALPLKEAGLQRLNISLNSFDEGRYRAVTRCGNLGDVKGGILEAARAGFELIKVNMVLLEDTSDEEIAGFLRLTLESALHVRFIEYMPMNSFYPVKKQKAFYGAGSPQGASDAGRVLVLAGRLGHIEEARLEGSGPAETFRVSGSLGTFGLIRPMSRKFCSSCNRLRLTSDGFLRACLHSEAALNLREALNRGAAQKELQELFKVAVGMKPAEHHLERVSSPDAPYVMCQIGG